MGNKKEENKALRNDVASSAEKNRALYVGLLEAYDIYRKSIKEEEKFKDHPISERNWAVLQAFSLRIEEAKNEDNPELFLSVFTQMSEKVDACKKKNLTLLTEKGTNKQEIFENLVRQHFPTAKFMIRDGKKIVSTYAGGITEAAKRELIEIVNSFPEINFDDGFELSVDGITVFNTLDESGENSGEMIPWETAELLSFIPVASKNFKGINWVKRNVFGQARPIEIFGGYVRIIEREKQNDSTSDDKADVILAKPIEWAEGLTKIKVEIVKALKEEKIDYESLILFKDFGKYCGLDNLFFNKVYRDWIETARKNADSDLDKWVELSQLRRKNK